MAGVEEVASVLGQPSDCLYAACYCEENVWQLCRRLEDRLGLVVSVQRVARCGDLTGVWVVFVSNPRRSVPLWCQVGGRWVAGPGG